jgi:hypothetical protein
MVKYIIPLPKVSRLITMVQYNILRKERIAGERY